MNENDIERKKKLYKFVTMKLRIRLFIGESDTVILQILKSIV